MTSRFLVDTNVLVYSIDSDETVKAAVAERLLDRAARIGGCVSTQVIGEFVRVATSTSRMRVPLTRGQAVAMAMLLADVWPVLCIDRQVTTEALRGFEAHGLPWWDAQLWATARMHGVPVIVSEDFEDGRVIDGVCFVDPFKPGFDPDAAIA